MLRVVSELATHKKNILLKICEFPEKSEAATGNVLRK